MANDGTEDCGVADSPRGAERVGGGGTGVVGESVHAFGSDGEGAAAVMVGCGPGGGGKDRHKEDRGRAVGAWDCGRGGPVWGDDECGFCERGAGDIIGGLLTACERRKVVIKQVCCVIFLLPLSCRNTRFLR